MLYVWPISCPAYFAWLQLGYFQLMGLFSIRVQLFFSKTYLIQIVIHNDSLTAY